MKKDFTEGIGFLVRTIDGSRLELLSQIDVGDNEGCCEKNELGFKVGRKVGIRVGSPVGTLGGTTDSNIIGLNIGSETGYCGGIGFGNKLGV